MSYHELEKNFADLKVNLMPWEKYIYPIHSVELIETLSETSIAVLQCKMFFRDGTEWQRAFLLDEVAAPEGLHELIGAAVKEAFNALVAWGRLQEEEDSV